MIIFGMGYSVESLAQVPWLYDKEIYYWGDIDRHGFAILSRLRSYIAHVKSFLMDEDTLLQHKLSWTVDASAKSEVILESSLTEHERALYIKLCGDELGHSVRLEQEKISYSYVSSLLARLSYTNALLSV